jgi:hypothetical protein
MPTPSHERESEGTRDVVTDALEAPDFALVRAKEIRPQPPVTGLMS